ncbi:hypothetical protein AB0F65_07400 [Nocardia rhamnosiphila]|uniref:hypothetical protein n=1 Tax=Nocardia rhamnosiphila TaxID=426716 RepID=UPI003405A628
MAVIEPWAVGDTAVSSASVPGILRARIARGKPETWPTGSRGRSAAFVTNTERATVLLFDGAGDPGEHAVDSGAHRVVDR